LKRGFSNTTKLKLTSLVSVETCRKAFLKIEDVEKEYDLFTKEINTKRAFRSSQMFMREIHKNIIMSGLK
jgi:hypothetical protein